MQVESISDVKGDVDKFGIYPADHQVVERACAESLALALSKSALCSAFFEANGFRVLARPIHSAVSTAMDFLFYVATGTSPTWAAMTVLTRDPNLMLGSTKIGLHRISSNEQIRLNDHEVVVPTTLLEAYGMGLLDCWVIGYPISLNSYPFSLEQDRFVRRSL